MLTLYRLILQEPWQSPERLLQQRGAALDARLREALACSGSLTRHLEHHWGGAVTVRLENQHLVEGEAAARLLSDSPEPWQALPLPLAQQGMLLRDAWLAVAGVDRLYAHSRVVVDGLPGAMRRAIDQGVRPLGDLFLQSDSELSREGLRLALAQLPELAQRIGQPAHHSFWCRHSLLRVGGGVRAGILEIFL